MLQTLINRLIDLGQRRIVVVDNASTYKPLLAYYDQISKSNRVEIWRLKNNWGHNVMSHLMQYDSQFMTTYKLDTTCYMVTDCDIVPIEECPSDFIMKFVELMKKHKVNKVGFGLKIDDLPDSFKAKKKVIAWESQFWSRPIWDKEVGINVCPAAIDTAFALCPPGGHPGWTNKAIRTGYPYLARHLPWYIESDNLSDEDQYYMETALVHETHFPERYREP